MYRDVVERAPLSTVVAAAPRSRRGFSPVLAERRGAPAPGVYCGGLEIKDGPLRVSGGGSITGHGVAFHLAGKESPLHITGAAR